MTKMFEIDTYINDLLALLKSTFEKRLLYVGLQGSYLRNEAEENSDIDIMVIIDKLRVSDLSDYRKALLEVGYFEKSCGFICGKAEMEHWNPLEVCHLLHATKDLYGSLCEYVPAYSPEDVKNYIRLSIGNLFHELCHRYIHSTKEKNLARLPLSYKSVFFILQDLHYLETGSFISTKRELLNHLESEDKKVIEIAASIKNNPEYDFDSAFDTLFAWCQNTLARI